MRHADTNIIAATDSVTDPPENYNYRFQFYSFHSIGEVNEQV